MDKFSYPDSAESSPRSRDVEFDNPSPWEEQLQQQQQQQIHSYKVKFMCSYGGKIQPRPQDNQLTYVNGETKIMSVDRGIRFPALVTKLSTVVCGGGEISFKYQLPGEDLDALISVTNDDDLENMMHEYDRLLRMSSKPARLRLFLFPSFSISGGFGSEGSIKSDRGNLHHQIPSRHESEKSVTALPDNADFLFGSEKVIEAQAPTPPSPMKVAQPVPLEPPPMFVDQRIIRPDNGVNPMDIQRQNQEFQIRDQEQQQQQMLHQNQLHQQQLQQEATYQNQLHHQQLQQEATYQNQLHHQQLQQEATHQNQLHNQQLQQEATHQNQLHHQQLQQEAIHQNQLLQQQYDRKSEDETGRYFTPTYTQNPAPTTNPQPLTGYGQGNNNNVVQGNVYTPTSQNQPEQQQVYMIPAQSQAYQSVMRPTVQGNQGYYQPMQQIHNPDAYMDQQNQPGYNVFQQQPPFSGGPQVMSSVGPPMGLQEPFSQMGKPVYYTMTGEGMMVQPPPPQSQLQQQYQGMGQPVNCMTDPRTGPDGNVSVNNMAAPKVSQNFDSV